MVAQPQRQASGLAIRHRDGWWCGDEHGVTCYPDMEMARVALTIRWQMDGGGRLHYSIQHYDGQANVKVGEHEAQKTAEDAIRDFEGGVEDNQPTNIVCFTQRQQ